MEELFLQICDESRGHFFIVAETIVIKQRLSPKHSVSLSVLSLTPSVL